MGESQSSCGIGHEEDEGSRQANCLNLSEIIKNPKKSKEDESSRIDSQQLKIKEIKLFSGAVYNGEAIKETPDSHPDPKDQDQPDQAYIPHGFGKVTWQDGSTHTGLWESGRSAGLSKTTLNNQQGSTWEGTSIDYRLQGFGYNYNLKGRRAAVGQFKNGAKHGYAVERCDDGSVYVGDFERNLRHGEGKLLFADGSCYIGEFRRGRIEGFGVRVWCNGDRYEGEWRFDKKNGFGKMLSRSDGVEYEGFFAAGMRSGRGVETAANTGEVLRRGEWEDDQFRANNADNQNIGQI